EAAMLYVFTRTPAPGAPLVVGTPRLPGLVPALIAGYLLLGAVLVRAAWRELRDAGLATSPRREALAFTVWAAFLVAGLTTAFHQPLATLLLVLLAHATARRIAAGGGERRGAARGGEERAARLGLTR